MPNWLNHVAIAAPRNGTTSHTVDPNGGSVVAGSNFSPTAGRLLVAFSGGPVTSTTPSGWTLPTNGDVVGAAGLYVWYITAAGADTITTSHGAASNFPIVVDFYEFPTGSTFVGAARQVDTADNTAGPTLSGLTGLNWTAGVAAQALSSAGGVSYTWDAGTEATDTSVDNTGGTDGYTYSLTYTDDNAASSQAYTANSTLNDVTERLVVAVDVGAVAPPVVSMRPLIVVP